jgi:SAM-dependent methyltransferase
MVPVDLHYTHPRLAGIYDLGNSGAEDRDFYLSLAGDSPCDILDLGCGTGLVCDAFAALGHNVTGADPAPAMLDVARSKPHGASVEWVEATAEGFRSPKRFDLIIMTGHAFQVLLTDAQVAEALANMAAHLKPDGFAIFESRNPAIDWDSVWARERTLQSPNGTQIHASRRIIASNHDTGMMTFAWDDDFGDAVLSSESTLRFLPHSRIMHLAEQGHLACADVLGDWDGAPLLSDRSREMIFKLRRA